MEPVIESFALCPSKSLEAISQLKSARERTQGEVRSVVEDLLQCANQHGRLLLDGEPVSDARDIAEIVDGISASESTSSTDLHGDAQERLQGTYRDVQELIAAGNRLRSEGKYGEAIATYREAKTVIEQELTRRSGARLASEIDIYLRDAQPKKRRAVRRLKYLDSAIRQLDREQVARHGLVISYRRAAVGPDAVDEPGDAVLTPPLNPDEIGELTDYFRELASFEQALASVAGETGGPTSITTRLGNILNATHADALANPSENRGVVSTAATILNAYESLIVEGDAESISELATRLDAVHDDVTTGADEDTATVAACLKDVQEWVGEQARRAAAVGEAVEELNGVLEQLDRGRLARHGFEMTCRRAAIDPDTVDVPVEAVCNPPFDPGVVAATTDYYRELDSFEQHLAEVAAETDGPTAVTERLSVILEAMHADIPANPSASQEVVRVAVAVLDEYESLLVKGVDDGVSELATRLDAVHDNVDAGEYDADAAGLADRLNEVQAWAGRRAHRADLEAWRDDIRDEWVGTAEQQLCLDVAVVDQLTGYDSGTPSLSEFQSGLETAEEVVTLAETVATVRDRHESPVMDQVPEAFSQYLDAHTITESRIDQLEATLPVIERACTAHQQYPGYPFDHVVESLCAELETETFDANLAEVTEVLESATEVLDFLDRVDTTHPSIAADEWRDTVETGLNTVSPDRIQRLVFRVEQMREGLWEHHHLYQFDWQEFEELVAAAFQSHGYDTRVTQATNDEGVDVWAHGEGDRVAMQVKQRDTNNKIGRPPLQKLASTIAKGDADRVIVVTSSDFGQTAREYADEFGPKMELIDGMDLIQILTESDLPPPLSE